MSEIIGEYGKKTITATELLHLISGASLQKIMENKHKGNILACDFEYLFECLHCELDEFSEAFIRWDENPTEKNKVELLREWADVNNFGAAIIAKADNYKEMVRE